MKIENKEMLLYSMNTAYEELKCAMIEYNMKRKRSVFSTRELSTLDNGLL